LRFLTEVGFGCIHVRRAAVAQDLAELDTLRRRLYPNAASRPRNP
jgi:hypothetical protein